jgi:CBS domain-containing protein
MVLGNVEDISFSRSFASVRESDTISRCFSLFKKEMPPVLAVLDAESKYKGVIARRWIVRSRLDPSITKVKTLMRSVPSVTLHDSLSKVARLMIESGSRQLPVSSGEKILGFVTDEDVIHEAVVEKWGNNRVEEIMTKEPFVVEEDESVGVVLNLFREQDISHVPVVSNGKLVGIISIHDIIEHIFQPKQRQKIGERAGEKVRLLSVPAKGIMTKPVITALPETKLRDAEQEMHKFDISSLVVIRKGRPVGIVTKRDFLEPIAQMEMLDRRLTMQFSIKDVDIDDLQRSFMVGDFDSFARKYKKTLEAGTLFIYMKTHGTNYKGEQLLHCRLQLRTIKGSFFSSSEGWGAQQTFRVALDRLERQILRSKNLQYDQKFTRTYLRRTRFPLTEL